MIAGLSSKVTGGPEIFSLFRDQVKISSEEEVKSDEEEEDDL
jgi:hypothetical protein